MKVIIQRVSSASVIVDGEKISSITRGFLILLGIVDGDTQEDINWLSHKIVNLRVFEDDNGVMNTSIKAIDANIIVVSQFTLHASTKKGHRPSYIKAAKPDVAFPLYTAFNSTLESNLGKPIQTGKFGANMQIKLINDGPVTIIIDSKNRA